MSQSPTVFGTAVGLLARAGILAEEGADELDIAAGVGALILFSPGIYAGGPEREIVTWSPFSRGFSRRL